jgi:Na+-driven multidrug efflux pump
LNLIFIPLYGIVGAALATLISYTIVTFILSFHNQFILQFKMMLRSIFMISLAGYIKNGINIKRKS